MRLYLSGGIKNVSNYSDIFNEYHRKLLRAGFDVLDPRHIPGCYLQDCGGSLKDDLSYKHTWECYLKHDIAEFIFSDGIAMIPGWETSEGATLELDLMRRLHLPFNTVDGWIDGKEQLVYSDISHAYVLNVNKKKEVVND